MRIVLLWDYVSLLKSDSLGLNAADKFSDNGELPFDVNFKSVALCEGVQKFISRILRYHSRMELRAR